MYDFYILYTHIYIYFAFSILAIQTQLNMTNMRFYIKWLIHFQSRNFLIIDSPPCQIKSLLLSHHHSTSALVSEILMSVLQTVQKNNRQFTYGQTVQKKQQTIYIWTDSAKNCTGAFTVLQTVQKKQQQQFTYGQTVQKNNSNLHMDRHIYRLYRRQCVKYTYIYSVHIVYYKDILNYQRHIIHRMGTSALCTVSIHNVVYA